MNTFCKIYIQSEKNIDELAEMICSKFNLSSISGRIFANNFVELDINRNKEFDHNSISNFPDGFLFFKYYIDIELIDSNEEENFIDFISKLLLFIWSHEMAAVAACDFENLLPNGGGFKQVELPWPKS